jgi:hypothetical protein
MQLHPHIRNTIALADPARVERALEGLQDKTLTVHILGTEGGVITATVQSAHKKSKHHYGVLIASHQLACTCEDFYYKGKGKGGNGKGGICKHICATVLYLEQLEAWQEYHFTHKAA